MTDFLYPLHLTVGPFNDQSRELWQYIIPPNLVPCQQNLALIYFSTYWETDHSKVNLNPLSPKSISLSHLLHIFETQNQRFISLIFFFLEKCAQLVLRNSMHANSQYFIIFSFWRWQQKRNCDNRLQVLDIQNQEFIAL